MKKQPKNGFGSQSFVSARININRVNRWLISPTELLIVLFISQSITMKFIVALISLVCLLLARFTTAAPSNVDLSALGSATGRLSIPNFNCVAHCIQPTGVESDDVDVAARGLFDNYGKLVECMKKCSQ